MSNQGLYFLVARFQIGGFFTIDKVKELLIEAVPKLQFWNSNLKIRSFARLKA
jgi:hypothetical protein